MSFTKNEKEEEYFARQEVERRRQREAGKQKEMEASEKQRMKELHFMHCPKCGMQLMEVDYKNLKIDECKACKGIWLDHKELDAVVALAQTEKTALSKFFGSFK